MALALAAQKLRAWPYAGPIGLREVDPVRGRTDIHLFDQWCHLATVHTDEGLAEALARPQALAFDLDTYRLLVKQLAASGRAGPDLLRWPRAG